MRQSQRNLPPMEVEPINRRQPQRVEEINQLHQEREREWLRRFVAARTRAGITQQQAAGAMGGISVQLLSAQETGVDGKHLSFRRMWNLGPEFWSEMIDHILEFHGLSSPGLSPQDEEDRRIGKAYRELQHQVARSVGR